MPVISIYVAELLNDKDFRQAGGRTMPQKLTGRSSEAGGIWHGPRNAAVSAVRTDRHRTELAEGHSDSFQVHHQRRREIEERRALEPNKGPSLVTLSAGREEIGSGPIARFLLSCILCSSSNS